MDITRIYFMSLMYNIYRNCDVYYLFVTSIVSVCYDIAENLMRA